VVLDGVGRHDELLGDLGVGSFVYGPRGIPHTFLVSSETARFLPVTEPGNFSGFLRTLAEPADEVVIPPPATEPPVANGHMVLWQRDSQALTGLSLPSLRPFTIAIPAKAQGFLFPLVISGGELYAQASGQTSGEVWKVALPAAPK
jgi:hypothetical protein